jgi:hypothetical protein
MPLERPGKGVSIRRRGDSAQDTARTFHGTSERHYIYENFPDTLSNKTFGTTGGIHPEAGAERMAVRCALASTIAAFRPREPFIHVTDAKETIAWQDKKTQAKKTKNS